MNVLILNGFSLMMVNKRIHSLACTLNSRHQKLGVSEYFTILARQGVNEHVYIHTHIFRELPKWLFMRLKICRIYHPNGGSPVQFVIKTAWLLCIINVLSNTNHAIKLTMFSLPKNMTYCLRQFIQAPSVVKHPQITQLPRPYISFFGGIRLMY